jgi:hypothetical protein
MKTLIRLSALACLLGGCLCAQNNTVVLKSAFVEKYKDRATIEATFTVDHAHKKPNPPANDGDMHVAGRAPKEVGLPMVAEVMNAAQDDEQPAVDDIHELEGENKPVTIKGVWRFWFEHPSKSQVQFAPVPVPTNTNPDHSFEIHPITVFDGKGVQAGFEEVKGFDPYDAETAFTYYESLKATVSSTGSGISISAAKAKYNYTEFNITLAGNPKELAASDEKGGYIALADINGKGDEPIATNVRMIFVPGTPPADKVKKLGKGDEMHLIGIPRINLNAVSTMAAATGKTPVTKKLPYEMIIVAALDKD